MAYTWLNSLAGQPIMTCDLYTPANIPSYVQVADLNVGQNPISIATQSTVWNVSEKLRITWDIDNNSSILRVVDLENSANLIEGYYGGFSSTLDHINILIPIDEAAHKANFYAGLHYTSYPSEYNIDQHSMTDAQRLRFYELIKEAEPPLYSWTSVSAIAGKMGILSLSMIKDQYIGDGSEVTNAPLSNIEKFTEASRVRATGEQMDYNQTIDFIYSGDTYKMTLTKTKNMGSFLTAKFYLNPTTPGAAPDVIYQKTFPNGNRWFAFIKDDENEVAAFTLIGRFSQEGEPDYVDYLVGGLPDAETMHLLYIWLQGSSLREDWTDLDNFEDPEADGGGDKQERVNNPIPIPGVPGASAYDSGFMSQFQIGKTPLNSLSNFLWSDNFVNNVKKFFGDPRQIIMGITIFPVKPTLADSESEIKAGGVSTGVYGKKLLYQFERYPMGECKITKSLTNGIYWDYSPYTKAKIYLPFCGEHDLNISDIMGKTIKLDYTVDHVSGMCCAHLTIKDPENKLPDNCHYNFTGQMGVQIPISSEDFGGFYRAMLSAGVGIGGAIATLANGGLTAPLVAAGATANAIGNIANMGKDVQYTSGGGSIVGSLASEYPYITIEEPIAFQAENQQHYLGEPLYKTKKLKQVSGFTKIGAIHLDGLSCTEIERNAIRDQLSKGVIIQAGDPLPSPDPNRPEGEESLILLHNLSDIDTIGKKFEKDNQGHVEYIELTSKLLYNQDFAAVGLLVSEYNAGYNYAYIPSFGRVYYIDKITAESGAMVRYDLTCDASESFWSELKECTGLIEMNEKSYRLLMNNNTWYMQQNTKVKTLTFKINDPNSADDGDTAHFGRAANDTPFIITIAGNNLD